MLLIAEYKKDQISTKAIANLEWPSP